MPGAKDQLPGGTNELARRVRALENQLRELRAARRLSAATLGTLRTAVSGARVEIDETTQSVNIYAADETLLAQFGPDSAGEGGGQWVRGLQSPYNLTSFMGGGEVRFRTVDDGVIAADAIALYDTDGKTYADLLLSSGAVQDTDKRARLLLESVVGGTPTVYITGDGSNLCNADVDGRLTAGNFAWGTVSITPSAANTPTSAAVTGLNVQGGSFVAFVTANTSVPGSQVTGVGYSSLTSTGLTVWLTRTNTTATNVTWMVIGL